MNLFILDRAARTRFWLPTLLLLAVTAMAVNESTYQHAHRALTRGIDLTDARLEAANTLQLLTDAEFRAGQAQMSGLDADVHALRLAVAALPTSHEGVFELIAKVDPDGLVPLAEVRALLRARVLALNKLPSVAALGALPPVAPKIATATATATATERHDASDINRQQQVELRAAFELLLQRAADVQQAARVSLYDAMMLSRVTVHALVLMSVLGLVLWSRQLRKGDAEKDQARQLLSLQVDERTAELRQLAGHLENAREDERGHVARELHDDMGGLLTAMKLELARLRRVPELPAAAQERVHSIERRLNDGIALKRRIIENLRPSSLDQLGLCAALDMLCADVAANLGVPVVAVLQPVRLTKDAELTVYRVVQESLTNISKHASASRVQVALKPVANRVKVTVSDNGQGFDVQRRANGSHGLLGMRVRLEAHAGTLKLNSKPGLGTWVCAELPQMPLAPEPPQPPQSAPAPHHALV